jgi:hypothetical protein
LRCRGDDRSLIAETDFTASSNDIEASFAAIGVAEVIIRGYGQQAAAFLELKK